LRSKASWLLPFAAVLVCSAACRDHEAHARPRSSAADKHVKAPPETVQLRARSNLGVPVHVEPGDSPIAFRLADRENAAVSERVQGGRWLKITAHGKTGWINRRYVAALDERSDRDRSARSAWSDRAACNEAFQRRTRRPAGTARVATWNIRWFPDGTSGTRDGASGTDVAWLACAIAYLDAQVVAVQEFKRSPHATRSASALVGELNRLTAGNWRLELDACPDRNGQHVGFLFDAKAVRAGEFHMLASLNPHGAACQGQLRPGFAGYFRFPGGLDTHVVALHLKSDDDARSFELRRRSWQGVGAALADLAQRVVDDDVIFAGDLNNAGCSECRTIASPRQELAALEHLLLQTKQPLGVVPSDRGCSAYFQRRPSLIDHFAVSRAMQEYTAGVSATVSGYCREFACAPSSPALESRARIALSDHCPVLLDLVDQDLDPE
jgi:hypothetical protein